MATVLIVDDEESIQFLYEEGLKLKGHQILGKVYSGIEAIDFLKQNSMKPDFLILDHRMPGKNGIETLKEIIDCDLAPKSKILFVTADPNIKDKAIELGVFRFIQKPFSIIQLIKIIEQN